MTAHELIARLNAAKIHFTLTTVREKAIMFQIAVPGQRWEVEVFPDGTVELERFVSPALGSENEEQLLQLIEEFKD